MIHEQMMCLNPCYFAWVHRSSQLFGNDARLPEKVSHTSSSLHCDTCKGCKQNRKHCLLFLACVVPLTSKHTCRSTGEVSRNRSRSILIAAMARWF
jgi:hypothetical protein